MSVLKNRRFEGLKELINRKSFCEDWAITFSGHYKNHKFFFSEVGEGAERRLHVDLPVVDRWFRLVQYIQPQDGTHSLVGSLTFGSGESKSGEQKISRIMLMSVDSNGFFRPHTQIATSLDIADFPETFRFECNTNSFDQDYRYAFVVEMSSPVKFDLWEATLELKSEKNKIDVSRIVPRLEEMPDSSISILDKSKLDPLAKQIINTPSVSAGLIYRSYLDEFTDRTISGWAACCSDPEIIVELDVFLDDILFDTVSADIRRDDLIEKGITSEGGGFRVEIPENFSRTDSHRVSLRFPDGSYSKANVLNFDKRNSISISSLLRKPEQHNGIAIVVPVYNAFEDLQECIKCLFQHTSEEIVFVLVDDASPDVRVWPFLQKLEKDCKNVIISKNKKNKGFSNSVNSGVKLAGSADVILLNSDARVTPGWLKSLREAAYCRPCVSTVTPFSDNAGAFSAPDFGISNIFSKHLSEIDIAIAIRRNSDGVRPEIPTGNGFCMYVRRAAIDKFGIFDSVAFPKGYGEENDFCMRCRRGGWVNLLDDSSFVFHSRSASFGESKNDLMTLGRKVVDERYPEYSKLTPVFQSSTLKLARYRVRQAISGLEESRKILPRALFVYSTKTGGTPQTNRDLMSELQGQFETWTLRCDRKNMYLELFNGNYSKPIALHSLSEKIQAVEHKSHEYDEVIRHWLVKYDFKLIHIRHLAWHSLNLPKIASEENIPTVISFHDFYSLCPTVNLLDEKQKYCGGDCSKGSGQCSSPLWPASSLPQLRDSWIHRWRELFLEHLRYGDAYITTSDSAKETMVENMPEIGERIEVIPHGRSLAMTGSAYTPPSETSPIKVIVPGNIGPSKGLDIIHQLLEIDHENRLEFHVVGTVKSSAIRSGLIYHGQYKRDEIQGKVNEIAPTVAAIFSIWNETWCHTLTEMWAAGVPAIVFDYRTVADRVRESKAGWVFDHSNIEELYENIISSIMNSEEYNAKRASVIEWQKTTGRSLNCANMASRYFSIYKRLLGNSKNGNLGAGGSLDSIDNPSKEFISESVAVVCPAEECLSRAPASTHIRIWSRTRRTLNSRLNYYRCTPEQLLAGVRTGEITKAIVQRNVLPLAAVDEIVRASEEGRLSYIIDVDDQLLDVPESKDPFGRYKRGAPSLEKLISNANLVTVSTEELRINLLRVARQVKMVPNYLDDKCWKHIDPGRFNRSQDKIVMMYMGSRTHDEDLDMFLPAFNDACNRFPNLYLKIIGGYSKLPRMFSSRVTVIDVPNESRSYPEFVEFLASVTSDVDFGVCPLVDDSFNRYKSGLKHLEYCGLGLIGLYSKTQVYEDLVRDSGCGVLVGNTTDEWSRSIISTASKVEKMRELGLKAREWVVENWLISKSLSEFENHIVQGLNISQKEEMGNVIRLSDSSDQLRGYQPRTVSCHS